MWVELEPLSLSTGPYFQQSPNLKLEVRMGLDYVQTNYVPANYDLNLK